MPWRIAHYSLAGCDESPVDELLPVIFHELMDGAQSPFDELACRW